MVYRPGSKTAGSTGASHVDQIIQNGAALPFPLEARLDSTGEPVTLLQICNWQGHSPANIGVDQRGKQFLVTLDDVTITDARAVPNLAADAIRGTLGSLPVREHTTA